MNDDETLNNITYGNLKQWLTSTYVEHVAQIDKRLTKEIGNIKKDLTDTKSDLVNTNAEIQKSKKEFTDFKKSTQNDISSFQLRTKALDDETTKQKTVNDNNLKYLINIDRNDRRQNVIIFGVPEGNIELKINDEGLKTDFEKCKGILNYIGAPLFQKIIEMFRLGKPTEGKVRPIKVKFPSSAPATAVLKDAKKLKNLENCKIYIKPDKTKAEIAEYQRLGKRKQELQLSYPKEEGGVDRVVLQKGSLLVDGVAVDQFNSVQTLF